jgi:hypothetical protein
MVGVVGSSPIAPTKCGSEIKGLAVTPSPLSLVVHKKYEKQSDGLGLKRKWQRSAEPSSIVASGEDDVKPKAL